MQRWYDLGQLCVAESKSAFSTGYQRASSLGANEEIFRVANGVVKRSVISELPYIDGHLTPADGSTFDFHVFQCS